MIWYLDQEQGNDNNSGLSASDAFQTVDRLNGVMKPGDTLRMLGKFCFDKPFNIGALGFGISIQGGYPRKD